MVVTGSIYLLSDLARAGVLRGPPVTQHARMLGFVAIVVAVVILVFFALGYGLGRCCSSAQRGNCAFRSGHRPSGTLCLAGSSLAAAKPRRLQMTLALFGIENDGLNLAVNLLVFFLVVIWVALVYWTYADASRRLDDPMLVGCATAASLFPFIGTIVYTIVRPPEYLEDRHERELEIKAAEKRLALLENRTCRNCGAEVDPSLPALPELHAQAEGAVRELRQAARPALAGVPLLRGRGRRRRCGQAASRAASAARAPRTEAGKRAEADAERTERRERRAPSASGPREHDRTPPGPRRRPDRGRAAHDVAAAAQPVRSRAAHEPHADPRKARRLRTQPHRRGDRALRAQGPAHRGAEADAGRPRARGAALRRAREQAVLPAT